MQEIGFEPGVIVVAGEECELRQGIGIDRQPLGLLVGDHLQAMFDAPQEAIGDRELRGRHLVDPPVGPQFGQHVERRGSSEARAPSAEDELLGLDEELDLPDAAPPELDVMPGTVTSAWPRKAWIWRFIAWTSAMAA